MEESTRVYEWEATLSISPVSGAAAFIPFPWNPKECFGKANLVPVRMEFEGIPYRGDIANMGSGPCIVMLKAIRTQLGKKDGDTVAVRLWLDTEPRIVEAPADLAIAFETAPTAQEAWNRFSPSRRKEYVQWIESAKKAETRADRVAKSVALIAEGKKLK